MRNGLIAATAVVVTVTALGCVTSSSVSRDDAGGGTAQDGGIAPPDVGLSAMANFVGLPFLRDGARTYQFSSTDPTGGGLDYSNYLGIDGGEATLFDAQGPGVIYRFWHTGDLSGQYHFYLDGATNPSWSIDRAAFWSTQQAPFLSPLSLDDRQSSGGFVTYFPIAFQKSLRITSTGQVPYDFYNITYTRYGNGPEVPSYTGSEDAGAVAALWMRAGTNPIPPLATDVVTTGSLQLSPGTSAPVARLTGPGEIVELRFIVPPATPQALEQVRLQIAWDGETDPSVDAPLADFFGTGAGLDANLRALPIGNLDGNVYCFFPMPFAISAVVQLMDPAGGPAASVGYSLTSRPFSQPFSGVGYFHALDTPPGPTVIGSDYDILRYSGSGHYVGVNLQLPGVGGALEGNERIYVDGARSPSIQGTGTEDYFNGGWYFKYGAFSTPTHGAPAFGAGSFTAYRFHLSDVVPFSSSIRVAIQHGMDDSQIDAPYGSVAYFYATPRALATKTDDLDLGDSASVAAHVYTALPQATPVMLTARFFSDDPAPLTASGMSLSAGSSFQVKIGTPSDGVVLRRLCDQGSGPQSAEIFVDGNSVGWWTDPAQNATFRWREEDFWIPRGFTDGKSSLSIRISPKGDGWNEYRYQILTQLPP